MEEFIQAKWADGECPLVDGVLHASGELVLMECKVAIEPHVAVAVRPMARSTLSSFLDYNSEWWACVTATATVVAAGGRLVLSCGEGSLGGDGFVAVSEAEGERLRWVAFFQRSNPFKSVALIGDDVVAISTHDQTWRFPLDRPERVQVTLDPR